MANQPPEQPPTGQNSEFTFEGYRQFVQPGLEKDLAENTMFANDVLDEMLEELVRLRKELKTGNFRVRETITDLVRQFNEATGRASTAQEGLKTLEQQSITQAKMAAGERDLDAEERAWNDSQLSNNR